MPFTSQRTVAVCALLALVAFTLTTPKGAPPARAESMPTTDSAQTSAVAPEITTQLSEAPSLQSPEEYLIPLPFEPPADRLPGHPLEGVIAQIRTRKLAEPRSWVLPLLVTALSRPLCRAAITAYSSRDADGGGAGTRWGTRVRRGICAADPHYWGPGSVIWVGDPVNEVLVVEDTGGLVKGPHRFDVSTGDDRAAAAALGRREANYVTLYRAPPTHRWGTQPEAWQPPLPQAPTSTTSG